MNEDELINACADPCIHVRDDEGEWVSVADLFDKLSDEWPRYTEVEFDRQIGELVRAFEELEKHHSAGVLPTLETQAIATRLSAAADSISLLVHQAIAGRIDEAE